MSRSRKKPSQARAHRMNGSDLARALPSPLPARSSAPDSPIPPMSAVLTPTPSPVVRQQPRGFVSPLLERSRFAGRAGLSFRSPVTGAYHRDLYEALGYEDTLTTDHFKARYQRGGVAERLVEAYPRSTWGGGVLLVEDPDPDIETPFEEAFRLLAERLNLWGAIQRADILAGLGHYSVLLLGARGALSTPLPSLANKDSLLYLTPLHEDRAKIIKFNEDSTSPRYGRPEEYSLQLSSLTAQSVHWTRVVHIAEGTLENEVYGKPRLRAIWNNLDDLDKLVGGGSEAAWKRMDPGMQVDLDAEAEMSETDEAKLDAEIDEYQHGLRRVMRTRGADINLLTAPVAGFGPNVSSVLSLISATIGIPVRILLGSERGELASTQDRANWADRLMERRREFAVPLVRSLVDRLIEARAVPEPSQYEVQWPEIEELNEHEKATVVNSLCAANLQQFQSEGKLIITSDEIRYNILGLDPSDETEVIVEPDAEDGNEQGAVVGNPETGEDASTDPGASPGDDGARVDEPGVNANVRGAASSSSSRGLLRALSPVFSRLGGIFSSQWATAARNMNLSEMRRLMALNDVLGVEKEALNALAAAERTTPRFLEPVIRQAMLAGARLELAAVRRKGRWDTATSEGSVLAAAARVDPFEFNDSGARILLYARTRTADLITEINDETRAAVRTLIQSGLESGIPHNRVVALIQQYIGLRTDQVEALVNLETRLMSAKPGQLIYAGKVRIRVGPTGLSLTRARSILSDYESRLRRQRALLISRTEGTRAANEGQRELWLQALDSGELPITQKRKWVTALDEKVRDSHRPMHGQIRSITEPFTKPGGGRIEPGAEPNCRCMQVLYFDDEESL